MDFGEVIGYGIDDNPTSGSVRTPIRSRTGSRTSRSPHRTARAVRAFVAAAVAQGLEVLHEAREWPEYHPDYYGGFVRDPDGNNVEAVCHVPE